MEEKMLDFDPSAMPAGVVGWQRLLAAVEAADPGDETEWIEFKAGVDPASKPDQAVLAKAIVAFANRDPARASQWLGGSAIILIGIEPGSVVGAEPIDPAVLHDGVSRLLAAPAPDWDINFVDYKSKTVIALTVAPPRAGDPVHCIGRSSGPVSDGNIFVRRPGKSDLARSADISRLVGRAVRTDRPELVVSVDVEGDGGYAAARAQWTGERVEQWVKETREAFLEPLVAEDAKRDAMPLRASLYAELFSTAASITESMQAMTTSPESRTRDRYTEEVETYLAECREALPALAHKVRAAVLPIMRWTVTNETSHNLRGVEVQVHIEGDVECLPDVRMEKSLTRMLPRAPRIWGPTPIVDPYQRIGLPAMSVRPPAMPDFRPRPTIEHGGSVTITFPEVDLRAEATVVLDDEHVLIPGENEGQFLRAQWTATATNISGKASGEMLIPVAPEPRSLDQLM